jgi:mycothiol synthase
MNNSFTIRPYMPETDLSHLARALGEIESIDHDGEDASEEYLRNALTWPNYRPSLDSWVAELDGKIIGYASALEQPSQECAMYAVVHPSQRRKGLGSQLLELALRRAREFGARKILIYANEHNTAANRFMEHHQFQLVGSSGALRLDSQDELPPAEFPHEFSLKKYSEVSDPLILLKALNICYRNMWGHRHNDNPSEEERRSPRFLKFYDPEDILLLFDEKDAIFGICTLKSQGKQDGNGEVSDLLDGPGVIQEYREQGYQRPLVLAAIECLRQKGTRPITLEFWGDNENALNIYRSLGFKMVNRFLAYHKELE